MWSKSDSPSPFFRPGNLLYSTVCVHFFLCTFVGRVNLTCQRGEDPNPPKGERHGKQVFLPQCMTGALRFGMFVVVWLSAKALRMRAFVPETGSSCLFVSFCEYHVWHHHLLRLDLPFLSFLNHSGLSLFFNCFWFFDDVTHPCKKKIILALITVTASLHFSVEYGWGKAWKFAHDVPL